MQLSLFDCQLTCEVVILLFFTSLYDDVTVYFIPAYVPPESGDFDLDLVLNSTYFFS